MIKDGDTRCVFRVMFKPESVLNEKFPASNNSMMGFIYTSSSITTSVLKCVLAACRRSNTGSHFQSLPHEIRYEKTYSC